MAKKLPYMKFFVNDWLSDECLRACSPEARALWIDLLCLMHKSDRRGYLQQGNGQPFTIEQIARIFGCAPEKADHLVQELIDSGTASRASNGTIYSRRMIKEVQISEVRRQAGNKGGSPKFRSRPTGPGFVYAMRRSDGALKIGSSVNPHKRVYGVRRSQNGDAVEIVRVWAVDEMCQAEDYLHHLFRHRCVRGTEWFHLSRDDLESITFALQNASKSPDKSLDSEEIGRELIVLPPSETEFPRSGVGGAGGGEICEANASQPDRQSEFDPAIDLAQRFSFICVKRKGGGLPFYPHDGTGCVDEVRELLRHVKPEQVVEEIERQDRNRAEWFADMANRLLRNHANGTWKGGAHAHREKHDGRTYRYNPQRDG